ncbi:MAG: DUF1080 domain-containing protein [Planctomycetota bacterium]|nr:MAG: DUF1080 domain-containing protein [Planctomycetota bacterium]
MFGPLCLALLQSAAPIPALIVSGANNHDWEWTTPRLASILESSGKFRPSTTDQPSVALADAAALAQYRVFVLNYNGPRWGEPAETNFLNAVRSGAGVVVVHAANNAFEGWTEYEKMVALCWRQGTGHGSFHMFDVAITDRDHPVTRELFEIRGHPDELYHRLVPTPGAEYRVLATAYSDPGTGGTGNHEPMVVVLNYGSGRVFHTPLGHVWPGVEGTRVSMQDPQFAELIVRGAEWAAIGQITPPRQDGSNTLTEEEKRAGWKLLFDGKSGAGWRGFKDKGFPAQGWAIEDGCLKAMQGGGNDLMTEAMFQDCEFAFEWKVAKGANSGVIYRVTEERDTTWQTGNEYQILDDAGHAGGIDGPHSAAALYDLMAPANKTVKPAGAWNQGKIVLRGAHVEHWLNGVKVLSAPLSGPVWDALYQKSKFTAWPGFGVKPKGHFALQNHGDDVWFRNVKVREMAPLEPGKEVALFNGKDLAGWTYFLLDNGKMADVWSVQDGVIVCKGKPAGYIRTVDDFTNFVLKLEWRWSPVTKQEGNSGVLFRMQGPDKVWPRSIEAQLMGQNAGDFWCIDDYPMKTDAARTNGRNTKKLKMNEKPVGEWNQYEISVDHGTVTLKVNGELLNQATDCWETPGKICLQSEGAEIHFRNIRLTPLP